MSALAQCSIYSCSKLAKASLNANLLYNLNLPILPFFTTWIKSLVFDHSTESYGAFSHDVAAAILEFQNTETATTLVYKPFLWELNSLLLKTHSFVLINLHDCWPRE